MVSQLLHDPPKWDGTNEQYEYALKWAAGSLYGAGTESVRHSHSVMAFRFDISQQSTSAMETFILRMAMDPAIQKRAQAEIDSVTKGTRLPEIEDKEHLPYMEACVKEALRFHPPTPLGMFSFTYDHRQ
jgi:hypothetical protein